MREKIIEFIQKKIDITKPEHLAEEIADGLISRAWVNVANVALQEELIETKEKLEEAEAEVKVWNSRANRHN